MLGNNQKENKGKVKSSNAEKDSEDNEELQDFLMK